MTPRGSQLLAALSARPSETHGRGIVIGWKSVNLTFLNVSHSAFLVLCSTAIPPWAITVVRPDVTRRAMQGRAKLQCALR
jgi:hypothetical protein